MDRSPMQAASEAAWRSRFEPFLYTMDIAATGTGRFAGTLQTDNDADFILTSTTYRTDEVITTLALTDVQIEIESGRLFTNQALPIGQLFGVGQRPFIWPAPRRIRKGSYIQITLFKRAAQDIDSFQLGFDGFKVLDGSVARVEAGF